MNKVFFFALFCAEVIMTFIVKMQKYLQFDWLKQRAYFFLIATVQISMECETRESEVVYIKYLNLNTNLKYIGQIKFFF